MNKFVTLDGLIFLRVTEIAPLLVHMDLREIKKRQRLVGFLALIERRCKLYVDVRDFGIMIWYIWVTRTYS